MWLPNHSIYSTSKILNDTIKEGLRCLIKSIKLRFIALQNENLLFHRDQYGRDKKNRTLQVEC